jgi:hypothetical protein
LLVEAGLVLAAARLALLLPFSWIARWMGKLQEEVESDLRPGQLRHARRVGWAVRTAARRFPLKLVCLPQAVAAKAMLRSRGVPSTLFLGVRPESAAGLSAHAWLRAGSTLVTGRAEHKRFHEVARFT